MTGKSILDAKMSPHHKATHGAAKMTEAELQGCVIDLARVLGWKSAHFRPGLTQAGNWQTAVSGDGKGFPDLVLCRDRVLFVELKSARGRLSVWQQDWLHALGAAGAERHIWYPADWTSGEVERVLRRRAIGVAVGE